MLGNAVLRHGNKQMYHKYVTWYFWFSWYTKLLVCWNSYCELAMLYWMWLYVVCVHVCTCICVHMRVHVCACVYMCTCVHVCTCVCMCTCVFCIYLVSSNSSWKSLSCVILIAQTCKKLINEVTVQGHLNDKFTLFFCACTAGYWDWLSVSVHNW
jgi:hypothetical protein